MKCPKCEYLGFETGDRCRNCGYEFSLILAAEQLPDLDLRTPDMPNQVDGWLQEIDRGLAPLDPPRAEPIVEVAAAPVETPQTPTAPRLTPSSLPLFTGAADDDVPLVKLPAAPRAPLAVRRTPENPRLRSLSRVVPKEPEPVLQFEEPVEPVATPVVPPAQAADDSGAPGRRMIAALIDLGILGLIDITVLYFTLKVAAVPADSWPQIPIVPMAAFLLLIKVMYFSAFTAVGGQTIGKMGSGIRVVAEDGSRIDPSRALRRSIASLISLVTFGAAFVPAILGEDRRAVHDRVAGTRVVTA